MTAAGFRPARITNIAVRLGQRTSLGIIRLDPLALELDPVLIIANPGVDPLSSSLTFILRRATFDQLPVGRSFRDVLSLLPETNASYLPGDEVNIAGGTGPETSFYVDGVNVTEISLGSGGIHLPLSFVDEVEVASGTLGAEVSSGTGGVVNLVTRSGGERFQASVFGYFTNANLSAAALNSTSSVEQMGYALADVGGTLSGPLLRDRLSVFIGYDPTFDRRKLGLRGLNGIGESRTTHSFVGKLVWRASPRADITLSVLGDPGARQSVDPFFAVDSIENVDAVLFTGRTGGIAATSQARFVLGSVGLLTFNVSHQLRADDARPATARGRAEPLLFDVPVNSLSGGVGVDSRVRTERTSGGAVATITSASHAVRTGVEYEQNIYDYSLSYGLGPDRALGFVVRLDDTTYQAVRGHDSGRVGNRVMALFIQDEWTLGSQVRVTAGLRWSDQQLMAPSGGVLQQFSNQWQPRAGLVLLLDRRGRQRVTLSAGRFFEVFPANLSRFYHHNRRQLITFYDHDPRVDSTGADTVYAYLSPVPVAPRNLEGQSVDEVSAGYDRLLGAGWTVGVRFHQRRLRWAVEDTFDPTTGEILIGNPGRGAMSFLPRASHKYAALTVLASGSVGSHLRLASSYVLSRTYGNYEGLYDYSNLESFPNTSSQVDTPEQIPNSTGLLPNDRTHVFKLQATVAPRASVTVGFFGSVSSGTPRNALGASTFGAPSYVFLRPRGSAGRTPSLVDLNLRLSWTIPGKGSPMVRFILDFDHVGNWRSVVRYDDALFLAQDGSGNQTVPNPNHGRGLAFEPPFTARLGVVMDF